MSESSSQTDFQNLAARIVNLERTIDEQARRLHALENKDASSIGNDATRHSSVSANQSAFASDSSTSQTSSASFSASQTTRNNDALEQRIGGRWLNRIGVVILIFAAGFFLKYAFENYWIGAWGRIIIGFVAGVAGLALGGRLRAVGYKDYASGLFGGGIVVLYLTAYAAHVFYALVNQFSAFTFMTGVTALAVFLAIKFDALPIAVIGLIGGFLTPPLLASETAREIELFSYVTLLNAGVLAIAYKRGWRVLVYLAFAATTLTFAAWMASAYYATMFGRALSFATLFFFIFAGASIVPDAVAASGRKSSRDETFDVLLLCFNGLFYFLVAAALLENRGAQLSALALCLCAVHGGLLFLLKRRETAYRKTDAALFVLANLFLLFAVSRQAVEWFGEADASTSRGQLALSVVWTLYATMLLLIGIARRNTTARVTALVLFGVTITKVFLFDLSGLEPVSRIVSFLVLGAVLLGVSFLYQRQQKT